MLFDPFVYYGMAEMQDRHRDMRLDVDNMSYEVKKKRDNIRLFPSHSFQNSCFLLTLIAILGAFGTGRTHRRC